MTEEFDVSNFFFLSTRCQSRAVLGWMNVSLIDELFTGRPGAYHQDGPKSMFFICGIINVTCVRTASESLGLK